MTLHLQQNYSPKLLCHFLAMWIWVTLHLISLFGKMKIAVSPVFASFSYLEYVTSEPIIQWCETTFTMLMDLVRWEFGQGTEGVACVCSTLSGTSSEWLWAWGLGSPEASLTHVSDGWCQLPYGASVLSHMVSSCRLAGAPHCMVAEFWEQASRRDRKPDGSPTAFFWPSFGSHTVPLPLHSVGRAVTKSAQPQGDT